MQPDWAKKSLSTPMAAGSAWWWCIFCKDPTKVDRSAAYAARWAAKHVAAGLSQECEPIAYAIGVADPVSIRVDSFGSGKISDEAIADLVDTYFPSNQVISFVTSDYLLRFTA